MLDAAFAVSGIAVAVTSAAIARGALSPLRNLLASSRDISLLYS